MSMPDMVRDQYVDSARLKARIALHERFSVNKYGWLRWVFDQFELPEQCRILDVGCGTGALWAAKRKWIPKESRMTGLRRSRQPTSE